MPNHYVPAELRRFVVERAQGCCEYCRTQVRFAEAPFAVDHIIAFSVGGLTTAENLAYACTGCNQCKGYRVFAIDPTTELSVPLFHPRQQKWEEHFAWSEDFTHLLGLTASGNATIAALQLNRIGLVNMRRVLFAAGEHPPTIQP